MLELPKNGIRRLERLVVKPFLQSSYTTTLIDRSGAMLYLTTHIISGFYPWHT